MRTWRVRRAAWVRAIIAQAAGGAGSGVAAASSTSLRRRRRRGAAAAEPLPLAGSKAVYCGQRWPTRPCRRGASSDARVHHHNGEPRESAGERRGQDLAHEVRICAHAELGHHTRSRARAPLTNPFPNTVPAASTSPPRHRRRPLALRLRHPAGAHARVAPAVLLLSRSPRRSSRERGPREAAAPAAERAAAGLPPAARWRWSKCARWPPARCPPLTPPAAPLTPLAAPLSSPQRVPRRLPPAPCKNTPTHLHRPTLPARRRRPPHRRAEGSGRCRRPSLRLQAAEPQHGDDGDPEAGDPALQDLGRLWHDGAAREPTSTDEDKRWIRSMDDDGCR